MPRPPGLIRLDLAGFRALTAVIREGVLVVDGDLVVRDLNPAAQSILGRPAGEILGEPVCGFFGEDACPRDSLEETLRSGQPILDFQTVVRLGDGRLGQVILRTVPLRGGAGGVAVILGDVTEETALRKESSARSQLGRLVGHDRKMRELYGLIEDVAASDASVLIRGESGTGKELVARALHQSSRRADGPFVQVNCSALAETLLESELFGHVQGAYTGAVSDRRGRFEEASAGTLFLDEIGDVSPAVQVKLLRVLQERTVERVGDNRPIAVDVRLISATNRDLEALLQTGRLREDFYYRIKVVRLDIPPLRARRGDIPLLVEHFLGRQAGQAPPVTPAAMTRLMNHDWPGNVRELENALEHALVLSRGAPIGPEHLPPEVGTTAGATARGPASGAGHEPDLAHVERGSAQERERILAALRRNGWHRTRAARELGIDRTTLWRKMKEHGLEPGA